MAIWNTSIFGKVHLFSDMVFCALSESAFEYCIPPLQSCGISECVGSFPSAFECLNIPVVQWLLTYSILRVVSCENSLAWGTAWNSKNPTCTSAPLSRLQCQSFAAFTAESIAPVVDLPVKILTVGQKSIRNCIASHVRVTQLPFLAICKKLLRRNIYIATSYIFDHSYINYLRMEELCSSDKTIGKLEFTVPPYMVLLASDTPTKWMAVWRQARS